MYGEIPPRSILVRKRRLQFAGHCLPASDRPFSQTLFWTPKWRPFILWQEIHHLYPDSISKDLDLAPNEVQQLMLDKLAWRKFVTAASIIPSKDDRWWRNVVLCSFGVVLKHNQDHYANRFFNLIHDYISYCHIIDCLSYASANCFHFLVWIRECS